VKDGRSDPGHSKKRPQRAGGAPSRRASDDAKRRSDAPRRDDRRREQAEPGFGPFRGRQREGAPGADRPKRGRADAEARTVRSVAEEAVARASGQQRPALRIVHGAENGQAAPKAKGAPTGKGRGTKRPAATGAPATQRPKPVRDGARLQEALMRGARALDRGYEREALRILRPWREVHPESSELRELLGLTYYRLGRWAPARKELEAFVGLTDSTEQHPVLMDVARALGRFKRVEQLWEELRAVSPGAELVTEGRIVYAGALADQGKLDEAIKVLERAPANPKRILPHHLRLWYALADLHERAADIPAARALFRKISAQDPAFVDVAERLAALT
jgi:thioredoxin-like negative regulator of GroEL